MKIDLFFPTVMKMEMRMQIEMKDTSTLPEIKQKIFDVFWDQMERFTPRHGSPEQVILRDKRKIVILTNADLQERIANKWPFFEVVFGVEHLFERNWK